jgi:hypothetical protein
VAVEAAHDGQSRPVRIKLCIERRSSARRALSGFVEAGAAVLKHFLAFARQLVEIAAFRNISLNDKLLNLGELVVGEGR